jgi:RimJ/RimL family protein N-acetyltransferase
VRGSKVGLGSWTPEHFELWMEALHDPEFGMYSDGGFAMPNREKEAEIFEGTAKSGGVSFTIYALAEMRPVGVAGLFGISHLRRTGMLGISIFNKNYWGQGYGNEAVKLVVDYGFRFMNLHNIMLDTSAFNKRAVRAYEKAGFKIIGRRREANPVAGKFYDQIFMDCLSTEFESPKPGWFEL